MAPRPSELDHLFVIAHGGLGVVPGPCGAYDDLLSRSIGMLRPQVVEVGQVPADQLSRLLTMRSTLSQLRVVMSLP